MNRINKGILILTLKVFSEVFFLSHLYIMVNPENVKIKIERFLTKMER